MIKSSTTLEANVVEVFIGSNVAPSMFSENVTCVAGHNEWLSRLIDEGDTAGRGRIKEVAVGTSSVAATTNDTALVAETSRVNIDYEFSVVGNEFVTIYATFPIAGVLTIRELGLFGGPSSDILFARSVLPSDVNKPDGQSVTIKWVFNLNSNQA